MASGGPGIDIRGRKNPRGAKQLDDKAPVKTQFHRIPCQAASPCLGQGGQGILQVMLDMKMKIMKERWLVLLFMAIIYVATMNARRSACRCPFFLDALSIFYEYRTRCLVAQ